MVKREYSCEEVHWITHTKLSVTATLIEQSNKMLKLTTAKNKHLNVEKSAK